MINTIKQLFGFGPKVDYAQLVQEGATILDVRTKGEYQQGHLKGSVNIPLDQLSGKHSKIKKDKPVIAVCASGMRSASAKSLLKSKGFGQVYNGGSWMGLQRKLKS